MSQSLGRHASDLAVAASGVLVPLAAARVIAAPAAQGTPPSVAQDVPVEHRESVGFPQQPPVVQSPWWLDAGAVTLGFTALTAGIGVIGKRILELWKDYLVVKDEHDKRSLATKVEALEAIIAVRDKHIAWLEYRIARLHAMMTAGRLHHEHPPEPQGGEPRED